MNWERSWKSNIGKRRTSRWRYIVCWGWPLHFRLPLDLLLVCSSLNAKQKVRSYMYALPESSFLSSGWVDFPLLLRHITTCCSSPLREENRSLFSLWFLPNHYEMSVVTANSSRDSSTTTSQLLNVMTRLYRLATLAFSRWTCTSSVPEIFFFLSPTAFSIFRLF